MMGHNLLCERCKKETVHELEHVKDVADRSAQGHDVKGVCKECQGITWTVSDLFEQWSSESND
jgi:hypothetical protein